MFLVRVESLVCSVEMIGPSRSAGAGRDALPRVRRRAFIGCEQAPKKASTGKEGCNGSQTRNAGRAGAQPYVRLRVRTNSGVEAPIGQNTGCP